MAASRTSNFCVMTASWLSMLPMLLAFWRFQGGLVGQKRPRSGLLEAEPVPIKGSGTVLKCEVAEVPS